MNTENIGIEKQDSIFKEIDMLIGSYKYNYTCSPGDEYKVELDKLKDVTNNLSKDELIAVISYIVDYVTGYENKENYNSNKETLFIYGKRLELIKFIIDNNKKNDSKINDNIKDILDNK